MIAVDASVVIGWLNDFADPATDRFSELLRSGGICIAPAAVTEIYSDPNAMRDFGLLLRNFRLLEITPGYWERTGLLRSAAFRLRRKAAMADALIAQACIDADTPLLARDKDFRVFAEVGRLQLA